ncbi:hypothetical protein KOR34_09840 [Posidoniimonas corsicana]|uniref:PEP-CTERM protein-sorting domain-containing protein n=1 Tax=Posidoniimonas corsicana TaxID=1938618 RepID=A0A5C5VEH4_9BACT|nr:hypothetical protein [Posidoniimonas corsicana]TWT36085.1 hypothetical protein KOR34_09840 [Posidoniimonas corsicana]
MSRSVCFFLLAVGASSSLSAGVLYRADDGGAEMVRGGPAGFDGLLGNLFSAQPGGEVITAIQVAWGTPLNPGHAPADTPVEVLLYDDPNNDGLLNDLVLLSSGAGVISSPDSNTFVNYPLAPTRVQGTFFAAVIVRDLPGGPSPIATDQGDFQGVTFTQLSPDIDTSAISPMFSFPMTDGNAMVRAVGVPEPLSASIVLLAGASVLATRRVAERRYDSARSLSSW